MKKKSGTNWTSARLIRRLRGFFLVPARLSRLQRSLTRVPGNLAGLLTRFILFLGSGNMLLIILAVAVAVGAYGLSLQIRQAVANIWRVLITHQSFGVGFAVLFIIFFVILDIAFRTQADDRPISTDRVEKGLLSYDESFEQKLLRQIV